MDETKKPKVARMVMFKHGVAYLERSGPAEGSFDLSFHRDEMNDVLKSLAAWVVEGDAKITSFGFASPGEKGPTLRAGDALEALFASLRGRTVEVEDGSRTARGEVLGIQHRAGPFGEGRAALLLRERKGTVAVVDLQGVHSVHPLDPVSRERLAHLVTREQAATAADTRTVHVALEGAARDLRVAYVIPAPVWRVSYRLVREAESATLMAMGIVFNPVDEDLEGVDLTLTTGQPISFVIDLYHPMEVARPVVTEESRVSPPPTPHERAHPAKKRAPMPAGGTPAGYGGAEAGRAGTILTGEALADALAAAGAAAGIERGELFEYHVKSPLTVPRGGAAMVPLAAVRVPASRERIWRMGAGKHPDLVVTFPNDTGLVLEEGPAVLYDEGVYAGESMLPYTPRGAPVKMTFAKDLAVLVSSSTQASTVIAAVRVVEDGVLEETRQELLHTIEAENDHGEAATLVVEVRKVPGHSLAEGSAQPFEETAHYQRFRLEIPAHDRAKLEVREQWTISRRVAMESIDLHDVERWFKERHLDEATYRALSHVLALRDEVQDLQRRRDHVKAEQAAAYAKQAKISEQLAVLKETGAEGALRLRYVKELEAEEDKVNAAEAEMHRLEQAIEDTRRRAREELAKLVAPATPGTPATP